MRAILLALTAMICLILTSCSGGPGSQATAPGGLLAKDHIVGTWKSMPDEQGRDAYILRCQFGDDHSLKMTCLGAKEPITGKYTFDGDYKIEMEYEATPQATAMYAEAVKTYKDARWKAAADDNGGVVPPQIQGPMQGMFARIPDELPARETLKIIVRSLQGSSAGNASPSGGLEMVLSNEKDFSIVLRKQEP
jgi:hypothetical protein